ncbi:hypothetical protein [Sinorhizobium meliloti]|uniref:hypothetical protein n=1 Tax=Rhizobium meliloti TaxID=382 RepID=UPI000FD9E3F9|nr:hypothetical protein [Sinorhizobium meliloti]RVG14953.1 hypothetical protein CN231_17690 [Sinorhizobium meliloti]
MKGSIGNAQKLTDLDKLVGRFFGHIELETCLDATISRPRVRPVGAFSPDIRVEFPRALREMFPIGTRFKATVKVCRKHVDGKPHGPPYLKAYDVAVIAASISDEGLMAKVRKGSISGLAYDYVWTTKN